MSLGYADRLKNKRNLGGQLGAKEYHQSFDDIKESTKSLSKWVADAKRVFVFTGAGISTSCGIPDFRGPKGIWTLRKKKQPIPTDLTPFEYAKPSFTHMAIAGLVAAGKVPYVCSQNVDSMHLWSGVPRNKLAELHGNCFAERCTQCRTEYARDFQMDTVDFKPSGRRCCQPGCNGPLVDNILDWDTPLPEDELNEAVQQAEDADVALVLGTSLQIQPANEIPTLTRDEGGKMVIVNLQKTPKDRKANLIIRSRVDLVMALLMQELGMEVPPYIRTERLVVEHSLSDSQPATGGRPAGRVLTVRVRSHHGRECPLPMVESMRISVAAAAEPEAAAAASGSLGGCEASSTPCGTGTGQQGTAAQSAWEPPSSDVLVASSSGTAEAAAGGGFSHQFVGVPPAVRAAQCTLQVRLVKWADADRRDITLHHTIDLAELERMAARSRGSTARRDLDTGDGGAGQGGGGESCPDDPGSSSGGADAHPVTTHIHTFVSQEVRYDPSHVIAAFLAHPPPVELPEQSKKKRQKPVPDTPGPAPTRMSARLANAAHKSQSLSESTSPASSTPPSGEDTDEDNQ